MAYSAAGETTTYGELLRDVRHIAGAFARRGVGRGDRCVIALPTGLDLIRAVYATQLLAAVPVVVNPSLPPDAIRRRLHLVRASLAVGEVPLVAGVATGDTAYGAVSVEDVATCQASPTPDVQPAPEDTAFLQLTSGTTGEPRAAVITHRSLTASLRMTAACLAFSADDVLATWVPLHHDLGLVRYVFNALFVGASSHLVPPSMGNLHPWLALVARVRATVTGAPDSAYRLSAHTVDPTGLDLSALRFAGNGGEPVRLATIEAFERRFACPGVVRPAYGLAEATLVVTTTRPGERLRVDSHGVVSCGRVLEGMDLRIANADGLALPPGSTGEILTRGIPVFSGYFDDEDATRRTLRDGWLHTGDVGHVDGDGYLFVTARARVLIKRGGVAIAPREIEDAVHRVPGVASAAAVGVVLSTLTGTEDVVVVAEHAAPVPTSGPDADALVAAIGAEVRRAMGFTPGRILLVPAGRLPRTAAGKVQYDELRRLVIAGSLG